MTAEKETAKYSSRTGMRRERCRAQIRRRNKRERQIARGGFAARWVNFQLARRSFAVFLFYATLNLLVRSALSLFYWWLFVLTAQPRYRTITDHGDTWKKVYTTCVLLCSIRYAGREFLFLWKER